MAKSNDEQIEFIERFREKFNAFIDAEMERLRDSMIEEAVQESQQYDYGHGYDDDVVRD